LTFSLSCRSKKLLLFNVIPLPLSRPYLEAGLPINPYLPKFINQGMTWILLHVPLLLKNFRVVAKELGLTQPKNMFDVWQGDVNIVTEHETFSLLKVLPKNWYFSGPLFAHLTSPIPSEVEAILSRTDRPKVYFAMGSSANYKVLTKVLHAFSDLDVLVIAPIKSHLKKGDQVPEQVYVTDWLPAPAVMERVDLAVTHGGQGTVQTTLLSGKPFVGIGMQPEQDLNIYPFVKYGNAIQIEKNKVNKAKIKAAVQTIINDPSYQVKASEVKELLKQTDTYARIKQIVNHHLNLVVGRDFG
jgi:UDP:flavonoid glycosyltransferase YjiC (YdhE family)